MRFYGQSFEYWMNQDSLTVNEAVKTLESLEARETLRLITASSFSSMKKDQQSKIGRELSKQANPGFRKKQVSMKDLAKHLGVIKDGIG